MSSPPTQTFTSRPVYATLEPRPCRSALMVADDAGAAALVALAEKAPDLMAKATLLHLQDGFSMAPALRALNPANLVTLGATAELPAALECALDGAAMGLQAFLAGSEGLIAQAQAQLLDAGLPLGAIQSEHRGTAARRMQCVHCKTVAEGVTTDPYTCPGCGRALFVRDHFSRRLGAFQGVCIDAETPGEVPEPVEIR
ncbi:dimethylamine monooxygenase subunit DmmA family protein [Paracoccus aminovorans]|uniref:dimethylamine monooxygenase subunit DmmA family protein n=1 Tax=Paracoccus aminovorans TaxID=34004 RepID=UPI00078457AF|nr:dimethylamine monooxygenase subunit DmmA family protein [Paracoccus aminovorans]MDQ7774496.1 dimethylamine monooxygenase subunit DmmA family protein [Paracoccus aminovorans]